MTFLFGDSSPSDLRIDYIELLRDALDFSVQLLLADERMRKGVARVEEAKRAAATEGDRLATLGATVSRAVEAADVGSADSATAQCAHDLLMRSSEIVRGAGERIHAQVNAEAARLEDEARRDRERCVEALQSFLRRHDLPNMTSELRIQQHNGTGYVARLYVRGLTDLQAVLDLEIPAAHVLAHVVRVEKLVERLEVHAPEAGGWLRKEVKLRPQRLDKEFVTAVVAGVHETTVHLRDSADGSGVGFDLIFKEESPRVVLRRVGEASDLPPFDLDDTDSAKVKELRVNFVSHTTELVKQRKSLVEAMIGGTPLYDHKDPRVVVERLIGEMAPTVREIARRSLTKTELVLKRQTGDGRREEIFVSRADLHGRLKPLNDASRALFKPLELGDAPKDEAPAPVAAAPAATAKPVEAAKPKKTASSSSSLFAEALAEPVGVKPEAKNDKADAKGEITFDPKIEVAKPEAKNDAKNDSKVETRELKPDKAEPKGEAKGTPIGRVGPPPRQTQDKDVISIDDSLDRLIISDAAPKSK